LEVAPDLVKLLPGIAHKLAGFGNVIEFGGELKQAELATSDFLFSGHVGLWFGFWWYKNPYQNDMAAVCFIGLPLSGDYHLCTGGIDSFISALWRGSHKRWLPPERPRRTVFDD